MSSKSLSKQPEPKLSISTTKYSSFIELLVFIFSRVFSTPREKKQLFNQARNHGGGTSTCEISLRIKSLFSVSVIDKVKVVGDLGVNAREAQAAFLVDGGPAGILDAGIDPDPGALPIGQK